MRSASSPRGCAEVSTIFVTRVKRNGGVGRQDTCKARVDRYSSGSGMRKTTFRSPSNRRPTAAHGLSVDPPAMTSMLQSSYPRQRARGERARGPPPPVGILVHAPYFRTTHRASRRSRRGERRIASPPPRTSGGGRRVRGVRRCLLPELGNFCERPVRRAAEEIVVDALSVPFEENTEGVGLTVHRTPPQVTIGRLPHQPIMSASRKSVPAYLRDGSDGTRTRDLRRDRPAF